MNVICMLKMQILRWKCENYDENMKYVQDGVFLDAEYWLYVKNDDFSHRVVKMIMITVIKMRKV